MLAKRGWFAALVVGACGFLVYVLCPPSARDARSSPIEITARADADETPVMRSEPPAAPQTEADATEADLARMALDEALRARVLADYPRLADPSAGDWERANLLRQWAWSNTPLSAGGELLCCRDDWNGLSAGETFQRFDERQGGVWCGGAATALKRLYELFGFEAWALNSGSLEGRGSHVVTLVKIADGRPDPVVAVEDAYFNLTLLDAKSQEPLDYLELVRRLAAGEHQSIAAHSPDYRRVWPWPAALISREIHEGKTPAQVAAGRFFWVREDAYFCTERSDGTLEFVSPRCLDEYVMERYHDEAGNAIRDLAWLMEQGHPPEIVYLFLYPLGIAGPSSDEFLRRARQAAMGPAAEEASPATGGASSAAEALAGPDGA